MNIKEKGRHPRVRYPWIGAHVNDYIRRNTMGFFDAFFKEQQRTKSEEIYDRALQIFNSPQLQNEALSKDLSREVLQGEDCDQVSGAYGRFGHDLTNPIPVNGRVENSFICRACACGGRGRWSFPSGRTDRAHPCI